MAAGPEGRVSDTQRALYQYLAERELEAISKGRAVDWLDYMSATTYRRTRALLVDMASAGRRVSCPR